MLCKRAGLTYSKLNATVLRFLFVCLFLKKMEPRTSEVPTLFELHIIQRLHHSILDLEFLNSPEMLIKTLPESCCYGDQDLEKSYDS